VEHVQAPPGRDVPDSRVLIEARGDDEPAVPAELGVGDRLGVPSKNMDNGSARRRPEARGPVAPGGENKPAVRAEQSPTELAAIPDEVVHEGRRLYVPDLCRAG